MCVHMYMYAIGYVDRYGYDCLYMPCTIRKAF